MTDTTCPACGRTFRSLKGRSGHLATFNDGTHASFRQAHGMRMPLGPNHKPTKAGARVRGAHRHAASRKAASPTPTSPPASPQPAATDAKADFKRALQELTEKSLEASRARADQRIAEAAWQRAPEPTAVQAPAPVATPPTPAPLQSAPLTQAPEIEPTPPPEPTSKAPGEGWLVAGGVAAAGIGLAALVSNLKGANGHKVEESPETPPPGRPPMSLPDGIWAKPEAAPETTGNDWLDQHLGYSGGVKHRRHSL
ncbi:MAG: hypothetical protein V4510_13240 [bacterium]